MLPLAHIEPDWLYHILDWPFNATGGYPLFSGIGLAIFAPLIYLYKHNCHEHRCLRFSWQDDAEGHPVCKVHHPDHPAKGWFRWDRKHPRHAANRP